VDSVDDRVDGRDGVPARSDDGGVVTEPANDMAARAVRIERRLDRFDEGELAQRWR
jgi:hypothetical protein